MNREGKVLATGPERVDTIGNIYSGKRDYFDQTIELAERSGIISVHVSPVFAADFDHLYKFALAAPIRDPSEPHSKILGVITVTLTTDPTMGLPELHDERRKGVLVGRKDDTVSSTYLVLLHPAYQRGDKPVVIDNIKLRAILERPLAANELSLPASEPSLEPGRVSDNDYLDPVASRDPEYQGRWLAGFAR